MKIGAYYYPEQWPQDQWERDFDRMASMGLQIVHMGEFAWFSLEPHAAEFRFEWLDRCLEMARRRRMEVILCTPTAGPPIWLIQEHPEILPRDEHGTPLRFGGRRHYSPTAPAMLEATSRIVTAMAQHFGDHPAVVGWQIDNELSGPFDQNEHAHAAFRAWLQQKYGTIEALNRAWGNQFWNAYYTDFAQILLAPSRDPRYGNPHHVLDSSRFWSNAFAQFARLQANILKQHVGQRFITTNFMPFALDIDPGDIAPDLSLMSWDSYPVTGREIKPADDHFRIADPASIGFVHDQMASYGKPWALMELQPGHVNWSGHPVLPYPGAIRLWIWTALAHGAEFVTTYRFRQPRFGIEMFHDGLVETDGVTLSSPGGRQFTQVIDELKRIDLARWNADAGSIERKRTVGLLIDFEQLWWFATLPQAKRWSQPHFLQLWYSAATRLGLDVKILHPKGNWPDDINFIVAPALQMVDDEEVRKLHAFAERGGHLVLTCRTALMDRTGQLFEGKIAQPILDLIGGEIESYDSLPAEAWGQVELDGKTHPWGVWGDLLYADEDAKVLAKYADQFYAGAAAVIQRRRSNGGAVTYCGVHGEQSFTEALMEKLAMQAGLTTTSLPTRVQLLRRGPYRVLLNYQDTVFNAPAPRGARFIVGSRRVDPAGVAIWEE
ncbi:MAG: beta-galactosidase [Phycisphaerales bacterium]|jgi:beta-galactosidase|nr:beta-galactosidase [Phycisphaerales bacterium]